MLVTLALFAWGIVVALDKIPQAGDTAYIIDRFDIQGRHVSTKSKISVLIFFNTSCGSCIEKQFLWQKLYEKYKDYPVCFMGITENSLHSIKNYISEHNVAYPVVIDQDGQIFAQYKIKYIPLPVLIDEKGKIVSYRQHLQDVEEVLANIDSLLQIRFQLKE